jgi:hypothetical protein
MSSTSTHSPIKPTPRQLRYLRVLAERTGTTFTTPRNVGEASRQITELEQRKRTPMVDVQRERRAVSEDMAIRRGDAAQVRRDELSGYGSSATWAAPPAEEIGPRVVHCKRESYDVYVGRGRGSRWGNPFKSPDDGTREEVIAKYERWLLNQPELVAALPELRGKVLGCWCPSHATRMSSFSSLTHNHRPTPAHLRSQARVSPICSPDTALAASGV